MTRFALVLVAVGVGTGCQIKNELSCELPENATSAACLGDSGQACTSNTDCTDGATPVCKLSAQLCVQCVASTDCAGTTPVCDVSANTCEACTAHTDCSSEVCLPSGACAAAADVAYIAEAGTGDDCSQASPCADLLVATATTKLLFKISGSVEVTPLQDLSRSVTIFAAPGATLTRTDAGSIVRVAGGIDVTIYDLQIFGAASGGDGIAMAGVDTKLTLERVVL
nr:hypothetical protein [Deltaproteobacteria bacterium]